MAQVLYVTDAVVTGEQLRRLHQGQTAVRFGPKTVVTPTAWDYVRQARLEVSRGEAPADVAPGSAASAVPASSGGRAAPARAASTPSGAPGAAPDASGALIPETCPAQLVAEGRCDHPDRACGCTTDEFGSGYADGAARAAAEGAGGGADLEALVQRITDLVMAELQRSGAA